MSGNEHKRHFETHFKNQSIQIHAEFSCTLKSKISHRIQFFLISIILFGIRVILNQQKISWEFYLSSSSSVLPISFAMRDKWLGHLKHLRTLIQTDHTDS